MTQRRPMVAGNWKMNGDAKLAKALFVEFNTTLSGHSPEVVLCPPATYLESVKHEFEQSALSFKQSVIKLGAQSVSEHDVGAYTGEISASMLKDLGCQYVIIGHSERRSLYGETSHTIAEKFAAAKKQNLTPILCIGESSSEREANKTFKVIGDELNTIIERNGINAFDNAVIAYEPLWAIGSGNSATPEQAQEVHAFIRKRLLEVSPLVGENIRILYGGSVTPSNAADLFAQPDVDGGLIGGVSLKPTDFLSLCTIAMSV
ncbi:triose-phosphate isomerase [Shewanella surugensis]|uniref:Triosephosphate isomerase n=1 Tax=Shewanella surugensis TaxID=212020 RepID=A0ABT0LAP4_9GAMM|nr:triose-phosphate isomerase [Shewanella surugensis]MCL1124715.1 triose-phosphate isomerase [Shewanella surugensis]